MEISPLYETLILIEHKKVIEKSDLLNYASRSMRGVIGKMEAMSLIKKSIDGKISLSKKGHKYLNNILENLHDTIIKWDGMWTIVSFSIPEKERSTRDKFRRFIESIGMKPLFNSLWISSLNLTTEIIQYVKNKNLSDNVLVIRTDKVEGTDLNKIMSLWDFQKYRQDHETFIIDANMSIDEKKDIKLEIKKKIFCFALILDRQPKVPFNLLPNDWPYLRAKMAYKKLKSKLI